MGISVLPEFWDVAADIDAAVTPPAGDIVFADAVPTADDIAPRVADTPNAAPLRSSAHFEIFGKAMFSEWNRKGFDTFKN